MITQVKQSRSFKIPILEKNQKVDLNVVDVLWKEYFLNVEVMKETISTTRHSNNENNDTRLQSRGER